MELQRRWRRNVWHDADLYDTGQRQCSGGEENLYSIPNLPAGAGVEWNVSTTDFSLETKAYNTVSVTATEAGNIAILSGIVTDGSSRLGSAAIEIRSVEAEWR